MYRDRVWLRMSGKAKFILALALVGYLSLGVDPTAFAIEMLRTTDTALLMAVPLFTFAGFVLSAVEAASRGLSSGERDVVSRLPFAVRLRLSVSKHRYCDLWPL